MEKNQLKKKHFRQNSFQIKFQHLNQHPIQQYLIHLNQQKHKLRNLKIEFKNRLHEKYLNEMINYEKDINDEIFSKYFKYQNPSVLGKD